MKENSNEIEIRATPEKIWAVLTDLEKYSEWNPLLYRAQGRIALGEKVNISAKTDSSDRDFQCSVVKVEPNREFRWKFHVINPILFRGEHVFMIEPIDDHRVRFIDREAFSGLLVPLQAKDLETNAKAGMVAMGEALKKRVEI
ncbi:MAG: SRPBCC family protein [Anaerolineales bacterium]|jgi:hypothetical protein